MPFSPPRSYAWKNPEFTKMGEDLFYRYHLDDSNRPYEHRIVDVADPSVSGPILKEILQKVRRGRPLACTGAVATALRRCHFTPLT